MQRYTGALITAKCNRALSSDIHERVGYELFYRSQLEPLTMVSRSFSLAQHLLL